jgi:hypothetical protein
VNIPQFVAALKETGYAGSISVESGVHGEEQRWPTLRAAVQLLTTLRG